MSAIPENIKPIVELATPFDEPINTDFQTSLQVDQIFAALSLCQGDMHNVAKNQSNPFFKSNYADLGACWASIREHLTTHHLCLTQWPIGGSDGVISIVTLLGHKSGQWIRGTLEMRPSKNDDQGRGSSITYGRRYGLAAAVGLAQQDEDGNAASQGPVETFTPEEKQQYDALMTRKDALAFYLLRRSVGDDKWRGLYNAFPSGKKVQMKKASDELEAQGSEVYQQDWLGQLITYINEGMVDDLKEFTTDLDKTTKKILWSDLTAQEHAKAKELLS